MKRAIFILTLGLCLLLSDGAHAQRALPAMRGLEIRGGMTDAGTLGTECSLSEVPQWADVLPEKVYENVQRPLFAIFQTPDSNNIDPTSPLGVSVFADAVDYIRDADEHWERILWELESSERAIDATEDLFRYKDGKPVLPKGRERMFRSYEKTDGQSFINVCNI